MTGVGARHELDLQADGFGHGIILETRIGEAFSRPLAADPNAEAANVKKTGFSHE
jgi:hypothetical protein